MQPLPHLYLAETSMSAAGELTANADGLPALEVAFPSQFGGSGQQWSPEHLLMASMASCLLLSFKAVAKLARFEWLSIECESQGRLNNVNGMTRFTDITSNITLTIPAVSDVEKAEGLLIKAEKVCLVSNSLNAEKYFEYSIISQ